MMDYGLIIFDCDGVLVDSEMLSCRCLADVLTRHGIDVGVDEVLALFLGRSVDSVIEHYRALGRPVGQVFRAELTTRVRESFSAALRPIAGIGEVLQGLRSARIPYCVASSSDSERVALSLSLTGLAELVDGRIYTAQMVARGKPAPDLFLHAASEMGVSPERTLVVEDSIAGVEAGRAAKMKVWGFAGGSHYVSSDRHALLVGAGADRVFDRMADFWPQPASSKNGRAR